MSPLVLTLLILILPLFIRLIFNKYGHGKLPPGPRRLPIIGNLHMMGKLPHRSMEKLAQKYGPIMSLHLGSVPAIVISSPKVAELFLKQNDAVFASRPASLASKSLLHGAKGIGFTPYGNYWRHIRKICALQLLSSAKVDGFKTLRKTEIEDTVLQLKQTAVSCRVVDLGEMITDLIQEITFKMIVGKGKKEEKRFDLKAIVEEALVLVGTFNFADFIPILRLFDLQGLKQRLKVAGNVIEQTLEYIIEDHLSNENFGQQKDILDTMLAIMNNPNSDDEILWFARGNVRAIIFDLIVGGIDTSAVTITWALSALFKNPRVMRVLQDELDTMIGRERMINESDLPNLSYLNMVVKETFRLYPIAPFLIPHESSEDVDIDGYVIPKKSRILVNVWAIGRDPTTWSTNARDFYPERFLNKDIDVRGQDFELIPFGAGRRGCPGLQLGFITVTLILAQLVHCFDWKLPYGMQPQEIDMDETFGLVMRRAKKLLAIPSYRLQV